MEIKAWLEENRERIVREVQELVRIPSLKADGAEGAPFGQEVRKALDKALELSESLGFETRDFEGYVGHAELGGGNGTMGILAHLDIVPAGENWIRPPFGAEIHDNMIYGRGVSDNKAPAIMALFAAKAVAECKGLNRSVRVIFGCDEEQGWEDMDYYVKHAPTLPDFSIVPDAAFPLIYAEKGILMLKLKAAFPETDVKIYAGERPNVVPARAVCELKSIPDDINDRIRTYNEAGEAELSLEGNTIVSKGVLAHGSTPHEGKNAAMLLVDFLSKEKLVGGAAGDVVDTLAQMPGLKTDGSTCNVKLSDEPSGQLTLNPGVLRLGGGEMTMEIDIRHPVTISHGEVFRRISDAFAEKGIEVSIADMKRALYVDRESHFIKTLLEVYREVTGDMSEPISMGGGTYARALDNAVAFGAVLPDGKSGGAHQSDEHMDIDEIMTGTLIIALAIDKLCN